MRPKAKTQPARRLTRRAALERVACACASGAALALGFGSAACQLFLTAEEAQTSAPDAAPSDAGAADVEPADAPAVDAGAPETLIAGLHAPDSLYVDDTRVVWLEPGIGGRIAQCRLPACATVEVLAKGQANPYRLTPYASTIAWTTRDDGAFHVRAGDAGDSVIGAATNVGWPAAFGGVVYFAYTESTFGSITRCTLSDGCPGGGFTVHYERTEVQQLRATSSGLAWLLDATELRACDIAKCSVENGIATIVSDPDGGVATYDSDGDFFYYARARSPGLFSLPRASANTAPTPLVADAAGVTSLALDGETLYFAEATGRIGYVARRGGPSRELVASHASTPRSLTVHGEYLYWAEGNAVLRVRTPAL